MFETGEARHFKFGVQTDVDEYWHMQTDIDEYWHMHDGMSYCPQMGCIQGHVTSLIFTSRAVLALQALY